MNSRLLRNSPQNSLSCGCRGWFPQLLWFHGQYECLKKSKRLDFIRHSHASLLVEMGFQPLAIAERLGHEKIETTLNTYSHLYPNKQAELAEKLEIVNGEE